MTNRGTNQKANIKNQNGISKTQKGGAGNSHDRPDSCVWHGLESSQLYVGGYSEAWPYLIPAPDAKSGDILMAAPKGCHATQRVGWDFIPCGFRHVRRTVLAIFLILIFLSTPVLAQCDFDWKFGQGLPGLNGSVSAMTTWDPDGDGPQQAMLIAGGVFSIAGDTQTRSIAAWDGMNWHPLGNGVTNNGIVSALTVYNGELIAGGGFTIAGGVSAKYIARWNGTIWQPLGSGMG
jgi:hypothetical protein